MLKYLTEAAALNDPDAISYGTTQGFYDSLNEGRGPFSKNLEKKLVLALVV